MRSRHLVEPEALEFIEGLERPPLSQETLSQIREYARTIFGTAEGVMPGITVSRTRAPGIPGQPNVALVVYSPDTQTAKRGALLHIHGGGYVSGAPESETEWSQWLVAQTGCVVVAPAYRLAPENPHPAPFTDCYAALRWVFHNAPSLGVDPRRIGVFGGSAGGGLAAAVALYARDQRELELCFQCLLYPMLDDRTGLQADPNSLAGEYVWTPEDNVFGWRCLLGHEPGQGDVSSYASPARASHLEGLPSTFIWVGALDLFVDESIEYARRLVRAGVPTELCVYPGVTHGNILKPDLPSSRQCRAEIVDALRRGLIDRQEM